MPTKVKIDENLPREACEVFLRAGFDAVDVHDQKLSGAVDPAIAAVCRAERRVLVTLDAGFANIRSYPPDDYSGLVVLRIKSQDRGAVLALLEKVVITLADLDPVGRLLIVRETGIRIRD